MAGVGEIAPPFPVIEGEQGVWLLELDLGGRVERFGTETTVVFDGQGRQERFRAGLFGRRARALVNLADVESVAIQIDDRQTSWTQHLARGGQLDHRPARLYYRYPRQTLDEALLVIEGRTADIEVGDPAAPNRLVFSLNGASYDQVRLYPDAGARVTPNTWSNAGARIIDDGIRGAVYPTILGFPGGGDDFVSDPEPAAPALMVQYNGTAGGAGGPELILGEGQLQAEQARIYASTQSNFLGTALRQSDEPTFQAQDLTNRTVTQCLFPVGVGPEPELGEAFWAGYRGGAGWGGGILRPDKERPVRGLGDVIEWAFESAEVEYDRQRVRAAAVPLNQLFKVDTVIAERLDLVDWVSSQLASIFPIRELRSGRGLYYRLVPWRATAEDAVARLQVGRGGVARVAPLRIDAQQVANLFSIAYAPIQMSRTSRVRILSAERGRAPGRDKFNLDLRIIGSDLCRRSQEIMAKGDGSRRDGVIEAPRVEFVHTWSDSTAVEILQWWAAERCLPLIRTSIVGPALEYIEPLDVVIINDPRDYLRERVAFVDDVIVGDNLTRLNLTILPQRERDTE